MEGRCYSLDYTLEAVAGRAVRGTEKMRWLFQRYLASRQRLQSFRIRFHYRELSIPASHRGMCDREPLQPGTPKLVEWQSNKRDSKEKDKRVSK